MSFFNDLQSIEPRMLANISVPPVSADMFYNDLLLPVWYQQFGTQLFFSGKTLKNKPLFITGVVHATTNIKDIYWSVSSVRPLCFHNGPCGKKFQKLTTSCPFDIATAIRGVISANVTTHSPCISPAFGTAKLRLSFKCAVCNYYK